MDGSGGHYAKSNKPDIERPILYNYSIPGNLKLSNS
jgi:hypothetical protein